MSESMPDFMQKLIPTAMDSDSIIFYVQNREVLKVGPDGFFVEGRQVTDDDQVYHAFRRFLAGQGLLPPEQNAFRKWDENRLSAEYLWPELFDSSDT